MATKLIKLNGEKVPFTIFVAGQLHNPNIYIDYDTDPGWPVSVVVSGIDDETAWTTDQLAAFTECGADIAKIVIE